MWDNLQLQSGQGTVYPVALNPKSQRSLLSISASRPDSQSAKLKDANEGEAFVPQFLSNNLGS